MSMKVGLYFSTMSGNTERIAGYIGEQTGCTPEAVRAAACLAACLPFVY